MFERYDTNHDDMVDRAELEAGLASDGRDQETIEQFIEDCGYDRAAPFRLSYAAFKLGYAGLLDQDESEEDFNMSAEDKAQIRRLFTAWDVNGDKVVDREELTRGIHARGHNGTTVDRFAENCGHESGAGELALSLQMFRRGAALLLDEEEEEEEEFVRQVDLSAHDVAECKALFGQLDTGGVGAVSAVHLSAAFQVRNIDVEPDVFIHAAYNGVLPKVPPMITLSKFMRGFNETAVIDVEAAVAALDFDAADANRDGVIDRDELRQALAKGRTRKLPIKPPAVEVSEIEVQTTEPVELASEAKAKLDRADAVAEARLAAVRKEAEATLAEKEAQRRRADEAAMHSALTEKELALARLRLAEGEKEMARIQVQMMEEVQSVRNEAAARVDKAVAETAKALASQRALEEAAERAAAVAATESTDLDAVQIEGICDEARTYLGKMELGEEETVEAVSMIREAHLLLSRKAKQT